MTADTHALVWGSAAIGLAPLAFFFFQITYPKSQLIIVFIASAFFYLVSAVCASIFWYIVDPVLGLGNGWMAILPGIFFQFVFRCAFVTVYHQVEQVIETSIEKTEYEQRQSDRNNENAPAAGPANDDGDENPEDEEREQTDVTTAKLKLELNDVASGIAAGTGFGGMHAILLFGSLLASESADLGVLFQPSCPYLPSLIVSSVNCFCFFFLDIFWMLFTFFGMRRRLIFPRGGGNLHDLNPIRRSFGSYLGNTRTGGNAALWVVIITHFLASGFTTFNSFQYGCTISLPLVSAVVLITAYLFWSGVSKIYNPLPHSNVRLSLPASFSYGSRAESATNGDDDDDYGGYDDPVSRERERD